MAFNVYGIGIFVTNEKFLLVEIPDTNSWLCYVIVVRNVNHGLEFWTIIVCVASAAAWHRVIIQLKSQSIPLPFMHKH